MQVRRLGAHKKIINSYMYVVLDSVNNPQATDIACTIAATKCHMMAHAGGGKVDHNHTCAGSGLQGRRRIKKMHNRVGAQDRRQFARRRIGDQLGDLRPVHRHVIEQAQGAYRLVERRLRITLRSRWT